MPASADVEAPSRAPGGARRTALLGVPGKAVPVAAAITVAVVAAAVIGLFTVGSDSSSDRTAGADPTSSAAAGSTGGSSTRAAAAGSVSAAALAWAQQALPRKALVLVEPAAAAAFQARGLQTLVPRSASGRTIAFVVETQTLRNDSTRYPAVARALRRSVPVAAFTSATADVTIRQVTTVSVARLAAADDTRLQADQQLLDNRGVRTEPAVDKILQAGGLDARPAGVLALLTDMGPVQIVRIDVTPAERAAGRPARSLDLRADDPAVLRRQLVSLTGMYRLAAVTQTTDGALRATWPVDVTPINQPS